MLPLPTASSAPATQHALLVAWGFFARSLGLVDLFQSLPVPQKMVHQPPGTKLLALFLALLAGCEYLSDLNLGPAPLSRDPLVALAWGLAQLPSASAVSRTLAACSAHSLQAVQALADRLLAPLLAEALLPGSPYAMRNALRRANWPPGLWR